VSLAGSFKEIEAGIAIRTDFTVHCSLITIHCRAEHTMAISKASKTKKVRILTKELATSTTAIIGTFTKLTVAQDFALRKVIRDSGGKYRVVKNKLAPIAGKGSKIEDALKGLKGVSSVAFTSGDPVLLAKGFSKWVSENAEFQFKLGIVDGKLLNVEEVKALATMPGKEEIFAKLLFLINAPAQRLATVLSATGRDLAVVLGQGVEKEKFSAGAEAASKVAASVETPSEAPAAATEVSEPAAASDVPEPAAASEVPEPAAASEVSAPVVVSEIPEPAAESEAPPPASEV
jgi:large subunit ribosomal protein L10